MRENFDETRLVETRRSAIALIEDLDHMRKVISNDEPDPAELRRLSVVLRKHLLDGGLTRVAGPRIGRLKLQAYDLSAFYAFDRVRPFKIFCGTQASMYGKRMIAFAANEGPKNVDPDAKVNLSLDSFCKQRIYCVEGHRWVSRGAAIKFIAYLLDGAHPAREPKEEEEAILEYIRRSIRFSRNQEGNLHINFNTSPLWRQRAAEVYDPTGFDPVLAEMLGTATLITESDDIRRLEVMVRDELNLVPIIVDQIEHSSPS